MNEKPRHLDLFSGIGGFALAARWAGFETVGFIERDDYCQRILEKHWTGTFCYPDIKTFDGRSYRNIDLLTGGFPCQPFSCAGQQRGKEDDRYLWPDMLRVIEEVKPAWIVCENVAGIINLALDDCIAGLESLGYSAIPFVIPACAVDAKHRRNRVWIVANAAQQSEREQANEANPHTVSWKARNEFVYSGSSLADANKSGSQRRDSAELPECSCERAIGQGDSLASDATREFPHGARSERRRRTESSNRCEWLPEPEVGRVANGIPNQVDRLKGLGNAIVPQVAYQILKAIRQQL